MWKQKEEQASGMRKVTPSKIKDAAYTLQNRFTSRQDKRQIREQLAITRKNRISIDKPIYDKFDKLKRIYASCGIELTDPRSL